MLGRKTIHHRARRGQNVVRCGASQRQNRIIITDQPWTVSAPGQGLPGQSLGRRRGRQGKMLWRSAMKGGVIGMDQGRDAFLRQGVHCQRRIEIGLAHIRRHQIQSAAPHLLDQRAGSARVNGQLDRAARAIIPGDGFRQQAIGQAGTGAEIEHPILAAAPAFGFRFEVIGLLEQGSGARQQGFAHAGQDQLAARPLEQGPAQLRFKLGQRFGGGRLTDMKLFCGGGQRGGLCCGDKEAGCAKCEH